MQPMMPQDVDQVRSILMTHAEIQDHEAMRTQEIIGRLRSEEPEEVEMILDLEAMVEVCEEDSENLKRIAKLFGEQ